MVDKKKVLCFAVFMSLLLSISFAISVLDIEKTTISNLAIKDLNKPALFDMEFTNKGTSGSFSIYTLVGLTMEPTDSFNLVTGESKTIRVSIYPTLPLAVSPEYNSFEYKIKGPGETIQKDELVITIVSLKDAFDFSVDSINPDSTTAIVHLDNKYGGNIDNIELELSSPFFSTTKTVSLTALEKKSISVELDRVKMSELFAGPYIVNAKIKVGGESASTSAVMKFEEKAGISTTDTIDGLLITRREITKLNNGNTKSEVSIVLSKNLFSSMFTTWSIRPTTKDFTGLGIKYLFTKELSPGESLKVVAKTNWLILIGLIIAIALIYYFFDKYLKTKVVMNKSVSFVRTKGGEFALKVSIAVKARDYVERVRIVDRLPPMVKVFEGYGLPGKIDERNRRVEWNIQSLSKGEERLVSYIIYSKIGVMGKFELPKATAIYEFEGHIKDAESNDAFYSNEPNGKE